MREDKAWLGGYWTGGYDGEISTFEIEAVFTSKERAEAWLAWRNDTRKFGSWDIEEYPLNPSVPGVAEKFIEEHPRVSRVLAKYHKGEWSARRTIWRLRLLKWFGLWGQIPVAVWLLWWGLAFALLVLQDDMVGP